MVYNYIELANRLSTLIDEEFNTNHELYIDSEFYLTNLDMLEEKSLDILMMELRESAKDELSLFRLNLHEQTLRESILEVNHNSLYDELQKDALILGRDISALFQNPMEFNGVSESDFI